MSATLWRIVAAITIAALATSLWFFKPWAADTSVERLLYGNVAVREVQLGFRTGGRLETLSVEEGETVAPGDILATLDPEPAVEALAVAEAGVAEAAARLAQVRAGARVEEIEQARAHVAEAEATFANAERGAQRQRLLMRTSSTSRTALDDANAARDAAAARLASAREALQLAEAGASAEDIAAAQAALRTAEARSAQAQTAVQDLTLLAPSSGIVLTRARERGAFVASGQPVFALALTGSTYVRAYVDEPRLGEVVPGSAVTILTDGGGRYAGRVGFVSPTAEFTPKSVQTPALRTDLVYRLRILVEDGDEGLRQGMPVTVQLTGRAE